MPTLTKPKFKKFCSAFITLNENPYFRFYDPSNTKSTLSARLAFKLSETMTHLKKGFDSPFPVPSAYDDQGPATVLIVDRSIDLISPIIHSLSYECAIHDYFDVKEDRDEGIINHT